MELNSHAASSVTVRILKTIDEIEEARPIWEAMQSHPNADIDFYLTIIQVRQEVVRPHVVIVLDENRPVAMAVARVEDVKSECKLGYKILFSLKVRSLTLLHGGIFGDLRYLHVLLNSLLEPIRKKEVDVLLLSQMRVDLGVSSVLKSRSGVVLCERIGIARLHWQVNAVQSFKDYLGSFNKKHRANLLRPLRKLETDYGDDLVFKCFTDPADVGRVRADAEHVASQTYHRGLRVGFVDGDEEARRKKLEADCGWLRAYFFYVKEEPIAFLLCTQYGRTLHLDTTGYSPEYKKYEPGTAIILKVLEEGFSSDGIDFMDFGPGDADYKHRLGTHNWEEETLQAYGLKPSSVFLYVVQKTTGVLEHLARGLVQTLGMEQRIKRFWRNRLSQE
jgi:hypothetical protein